MKPRKGKHTPKSKYKEIPKLSSLDAVWAFDQAIRELDSLRNFVRHQHGAIVPLETVTTFQLVASICHGALDGISAILDEAKDVRKPKAVQS